MRRVVLIVAVVAALALMGSALSATAMAGGKTRGDPTVTVLNNPVPAGVNTHITFSGTGFGSNERVWVTIGGEACCGGTTADSHGTFTYTTYVTVDAGTYTASALIRQGNNWVWAANRNFIVQ